MNPQQNVSQQIADLEARRAAIRQSQDARQREAQQSAINEQTLADTERQLQALRAQAAAQQAQALMPQNDRLIAEYDALTHELFARLDAWDVQGALAALTTVESAWRAQQAFKKQIINAYAPEFNAAGQRAREQALAMGYDGGREFVEAQRFAWLGKLGTIPNAMHPASVVAAWVVTKNGRDRQTAVGLAFALTGEWIDPSPQYDPRADSNQRISAGVNY